MAPVVAEPPEALDAQEVDAERRNVARLIRTVAAFVLVPTVTIGTVLEWDPQTRGEHWLHAGAFMLLAVAALVAMVQAPRLAARFVKG